MSAPTNQWKLGLFVVVTLFLGLAAAIYLGAQSFKKDMVSYKSYFDESVQGLEVGSPLKFRGVTIGYISGIDVAPDRRHVEVTFSIEVDTLAQMGLRTAQNRRVRMPKDLRAQIAAAGITGVKFIQIDYLSNAPPKLPFKVPSNYVPAAPSTMKNIEDAVLKTVNQIPDIATHVRELVTTLNNFVREIDAQRLARGAGETLANVNLTLTELRTVIKAIDAPQLSKQSQQVLTRLDKALLRIDGLVQHLESDKGPLVSARRTSDAIGEVARGARGLGKQMDGTLRGIHEAADSIRRLADALEQDPDMLLKGRSERKP